MIFTTPAFVVFITFFLLFWIGLPRVRRRDKLLLASYVFYGYWDVRFLSLIVISTLVDFAIGKRLDVVRTPSLRKRLVTTSVIVNLGLLGFFKYCNFFIASAQSALSSIGIRHEPLMLDIVLPVGISFYTFQTLSYTIDIYRGRLKATDRLLDFALFVAFFPQLIAGPIERATRFLPQIAQIEKARPIWSGLFLIALGCFKKAAIADNIASLVDPVYADPLGAHAPAVWLATYGFAIQIYFDFSGYSDIAVGLARMFGINLMQNFRAPYAALGPSDFWRRWHSSLSTWLRDYLYISLGGNRRGRLFTLRNLMLTMLLGGLWHGAAWNFVLWGAWHGGLLVIFRQPLFAAIGARLDDAPLRRYVSRPLRRLAFFHLVCIGWALFRLENPGESLSLLQHMCSADALHLTEWISQVEQSGESRWLMAWTAVIGGTILSQWFYDQGSDDLSAALWKYPEWIRALVVMCLLYCALIGAPESQPPFIYFQF